VTTHLSARRFFYIQRLKKPWSIADTPYPKKAHRLPTILSQEEVAQLIDAACTPFHRPASAANPSGFLLTALSNARRLAFLASTLLREGARPIKHLRDAGTIAKATRRIAFPVSRLAAMWTRNSEKRP